MLALILTRKLRPMIIGSSSGWLMLAGMMARPRATSRADEFGGDFGWDAGAEGFAGVLVAERSRISELGSRNGSTVSRSSSAFRVRRPFSRMAMNSISGVMMPWRAYQSCVTG